MRWSSHNILESASVRIINANLTTWIGDNERTYVRRTCQRTQSRNIVVVQISGLQHEIANIPRLASILENESNQIHRHGHQAHPKCLMSMTTNSGKPNYRIRCPSHRYSTTVDRDQA